MSEAKSIVIIDDSSEILDLLNLAFVEAGWRTWILQNPLDAFEFLVWCQRPDVVLSDFNMNETTGVELHGALLESGVDLPFILMTGSADLSESEIQTRGILKLITKPFNPFNIVKEISDTLSRRAASGKLSNLEAG